LAQQSSCRPGVAAWLSERSMTCSEQARARFQRVGDRYGQLRERVTVS
jgi:hypothetical protein